MVKVNVIKSDFIEGHREFSKASTEVTRREWVPPSKGNTLTLQTTNPCILTFKAMEYAARGPVIQRALQIESELKSGATSKPFNEILKFNLGDAHAMGQKPITFIREVLALVACPQLIETTMFNEDVKEKARKILSSCRGGSAGSYSDSRGLEVVRKHVAEFIERRDNGIPANPDDVFLCAGASEGIRACLKLFKCDDRIDGLKSGVLVPIPEYPLYSATLGEYDMHKLNYYLDESQNWGLNIGELEKVLEAGRRICKPRAIVVINPGNPTGHVLSKENIEEIIRFAYNERLFILADEVYQDNVYEPRKFVSFKKVLMEMNPPYNQVELVSFYSCSKGYVCECGLRGAYFEVVNMDPEVKSILSASVAAKLCPTVLGQAAVDCAVDPPKPGDPSFELYNQEKHEILSKLGERADLVTKGFQTTPGVECSSVEGAMYAFPKVLLPEKAILAAKADGKEPDVFYSLHLLEETGICVVPGSGIGQIPGTYHFRTTILASTDEMRRMLEKFKEFHMSFTQKYS